MSHAEKDRIRHKRLKRGKRTRGVRIARKKVWSAYRTQMRSVSALLSRLRESGRI
jgi:hypothetical protein